MKKKVQEVAKWYLLQASVLILQKALKMKEELYAHNLLKEKKFF